MAEKLAFCTLLWEEHGGKLGPKGQPQIESGDPIRGYCTRPFDCYNCVLMQKTLNSLSHHGYLVVWVCGDCLTGIKNRANKVNVNISIPGHYSEGYCQHPTCIRSEGDDNNRYSILLQLLVVDGDIIP